MRKNTPGSQKRGNLTAKVSGFRWKKSKLKGLNRFKKEAQSHVLNDHQKTYLMFIHDRNANAYQVLKEQTKANNDLATALSSDTYKIQRVWRALKDGANFNTVKIGVHAKNAINQSLILFQKLLKKFCHKEHVAIKKIRELWTLMDNAKVDWFQIDEASRQGFEHQILKSSHLNVSTTFLATSLNWWKDKGGSPFRVCKMGCRNLWHKAIIQQTPSILPILANIWPEFKAVEMHSYIHVRSLLQAIWPRWEHDPLQKIKATSRMDSLIHHLYGEKVEVSWKDRQVSQWMTQLGCLSISYIREMENRSLAERERNVLWAHIAISINSKESLVNEKSKSWL